MTNKISGMDTEFVDDSVKPGDDFFRHVNGKWLDTYEIPADRSKDGGLYFLRDDAEKHVREIVEKIAKEQPNSRIGILFNAFMDEEAIEKKGLESLNEELQPILNAQTSDELAQVMGELDRTGAAGGLFAEYVSIDAKNPEKYVFYLMQSGISLPDESYYREEKHAELREKFVAHVEKMFELTGAAENFALDPATAASLVLAHETEIASHHWDNVALRDADKRYNPYEAADLEEKFPGFPFSKWIASLNTSEEKLGSIIVGQPSFVEEAAKMWANVPLMTWKVWFAWKLVHARAAYLTSDLVQENFDFYGKTLSGTEELRERWKRALSVVEGAVPDEVGQEYVAVHFPPSHKEKMLKLVDKLLQAYRESISTLDWMTDETRERALEKLSLFKTKIGYPDKWRDFSDLELVEGDLFASLRRASAFEHDFQLGRAHEPVDKTEWLMSPQTVNAYYMPPANEIAFPAAILQPPYFDPEADDAANYGGIGAIIGHEIGHGFDDQGSKFDGTGALNNWWTDADREEFSKRTGSLVGQYNEYTPEGLDPENYKVNGELTLGENIGDLGGLSIALKAYKLALAEEGITSFDDAPVIDGFTGLQRVFWSWAQGWRSKSRQQFAEMMLTVDPHSPSEFRVNGIVRNIDEFYEAFDVTEDQALYLNPEDRVKIW